MARAILIGAMLLGLCAPAAFAQDGTTYTVEEYAAAIDVRRAEIEATYWDGDKSDAIKQAFALNTEVDQYEDFLAGHPGYWVPDLLIAQLAIHTEDFDVALKYAAPLVQALNSPEHYNGQHRVEGLFFLARALYSTNQFSDAEAVLRSFGAVATPQNSTSSWRQSMDYMLVRTVTRTAAPDADALRHAILDGFMDREDASKGLYLRMWFADLNAHYDEGKTPMSAVRNARHVAEELAQLGADAVGEYQALYGLLARIFADNRDFARALPLLETRMAYLAKAAPTTPDRFWAAQNLAGLRNLQKDYVGAMQDAAAGLADIDALDDSSDDEFHDLRASFEMLISVAAEGLGQTRISQDALQRAYSSMRQIKSANHPEVVKLAERLIKKMVDPAIFPYAAELGLDAPQSMNIHLDGNGVIDAFFAGHYAQTARVLTQLEDNDDIPKDVVAMQWAYYHALLGEIEPGLEKIKQARLISRQSLGAHMKANDYHPDLAEALLMIYARDFEPERGADALSRLENRTDLPEQTQAIVRMLRATYVQNDGRLGDAIALYQQIEQQDFPLVDQSAWGTILGLGLLNLALQIEDVDTARHFATQYAKQMETSQNRALASVILQIFMLNADPGASSLASGFQALAFHIRSLSGMLPASHQWSIAANVAYANALSGRGEHQAAANLLDVSLKNYRKSPWHRKDVAAFIQVTRAWELWSLGQEDLAATVFAQASDGLDIEKWRAVYTTGVVMALGFSQWVQGQPEAAIATMESLLKREDFTARLSPQDAVTLYMRYGEFLMYSEMYFEAGNAFDDAVAAVPTPEYNKGFPLAEALQRRALFHSTLEQSKRAYADIARSNQLWFSYYESGDVARAKDFDRARVLEEANYAWALHQQLEGEK